MAFYFDISWTSTVLQLPYFFFFYSTFHGISIFHGISTFTLKPTALSLLLANLPICARFYELEQSSALKGTRFCLKPLVYPQTVPHMDHQMSAEVQSTQSYSMPVQPVVRLSLIVKENQKLSNNIFLVLENQGFALFLARICDRNNFIHALSGSCRENHSIMHDIY